MKPVQLKLLFLSVILVFIYNIAQGQVSPWGTGQINNQVLGNLTVPVNSTSHAGWNFVPNDFLSTYNYNIYIPASYDGTQPYGLITFVNAGNTGSIIASWKAVLDEKKIIMIAGNAIGNSVQVPIRRSVALGGVYRMKELLNIDTTRIYSSGNSGGGRVASELMHLYPEVFYGMVPNCGASFLRQVDQDYETHSPNSHYEYLYPFTQAQLDYVNSFDRRYALLTAFDDFREGDIMNIYHNGLEPDGFKGKILEIAGGHCATSEEHFRDAVNFVEHPHIDVVRDSFQTSPIVGNGFHTSSTNISASQLVFNHDNANMARAYSRDPFLWNDDKGSIIRTSLICDSSTFNQNTFFNIGFLELDNDNIYTQNVGGQLFSGKPNIITSVVFNNAQPWVYILVENPFMNVSNDTILKAQFADWNISTSLDVKYHIWNSELRVEFGKHFAPASVSVANTNVKLLDDNRSVRYRWSNIFGIV